MSLLTHEAEAMNPDAPTGSLAQNLFRVAGFGAVVTGAGSGLGLAMARVLARNGARVTLADIDERAVQAAAEQLAGEGGSVRVAVLDVADAQAVDELMNGAAGWGGGLQVVFANAGISAGPGPLREGGNIEAVDGGRWQRVLDVNLSGVLFSIRAAAKVMNTGYGRIVVTSSVAGIRAEPFVGYAYAAAKHAVVGLVRNAAVELADRGILVNAIAPGLFRTNIAAAAPDREKFLADLSRTALLGRAAETTEIEGLALFLASPASSYITGSVLAIDGGASALRNSL